MFSQISTTTATITVGLVAIFLIKYNSDINRLANMQRMNAVGSTKKGNSSALKTVRDTARNFLNENLKESKFCGGCRPAHYGHHAHAHYAHAQRMQQHGHYGQGCQCGHCAHAQHAHYARLQHAHAQRMQQYRQQMAARRHSGCGCAQCRGGACYGGGCYGQYGAYRR